MDKNLPIKIVLPRKNDVKPKPAGGGVGSQNFLEHLIIKFRLK